MAAPKLNAEQKATIRGVLKEADAFGATPMEKLAAIQTIGVEANYGNPNFGDRDSLGPFQQRASWGTAQDRTNPEKAARKFFETARQMRQGKKFTTAGSLAAAVQRPAAEYAGRYQQRRGEALSILQEFGGGGSGSSGSGLAAALSGPEQAFDSTRGTVSGLEISTAPLAAAVPVTGPAAPAVGGQPTMPAGYAGAPMAGAPQAPEQPNLDAQTPDYSIDTQQQAAADAGGSDSSTSDEAAVAAGGAGAKPRVKIASGANAAGKPIAKSLLNVLDEISSAADREIVVTTGTNHSTYTTSGNISEHSTGHGADIAATGKALTDGATDALLTLARGKTVQWLRNDGKVVNVKLTPANTRKLVQSGGIFNVPHGDGGRIQVIANTHQGGDHTNHWHVGLREAA